jgi:hypothetical protein
LCLKKAGFVTQMLTDIVSQFILFIPQVLEMEETTNAGSRENTQESKSTLFLTGEQDCIVFE